MFCQDYGIYLLVGNDEETVIRVLSWEMKDEE